MACGTGGLVARSLVLQLSYQKLGSTSRRRARLTLDPADLEMGRQGSAHGRDLHDGNQPNIDKPRMSVNALKKSIYNCPIRAGVSAHGLCPLRLHFTIGSY